jgi:phytoene dehydrogenase-like protein
MVEKRYDFVVIGSGIGGLSIAALLANKEKSICLIEGNKFIGGYSSTIQEKGYSFTHGVKYLFGCGPQSPNDRFLKEVKLDKKIKFNSFSKDCYDLIHIPSKDVRIPFGGCKYRNRLIKLYPEYKEGLTKYFDIFEKIFKELRLYKCLPDKKYILHHPLKHRTLFKYEKTTAQEFLDSFDFPMDLQTILAGQIGNLALPPKEASLLAHAGMVIFYCNGAHFPAKGMKYFDDELVKVVSSHKDCDIFCNQFVKEIHINGDNSYVVTEKDKKIYGRNIISNIDPFQTLGMVEGAKIHRFKKDLKYKYSDSFFQVFLGLKNIDLKKYGFGKWNTWFHQDIGVNKEYNALMKKNDVTHSVLFIGTPSLLTDKNVLAPSGCETMEIITTVSYHYFKKLYDNDRKKYSRIKRQVADSFIDVLEKHYIPAIREHIEVKEVWSPIDIEKTFRTVKANMVGSSFNTDNVSLDRITWKTPFNNLFFIGATSTMPGITGVITGSLRLYDELIK